jgi:hypothetical protein
MEKGKESFEPWSKPRGQCKPGTRACLEEEAPLEKTMPKKGKSIQKRDAIAKGMKRTPLPSRVAVAIGVEEEPETIGGEGGGPVGPIACEVLIPNHIVERRSWIALATKEQIPTSNHGDSPTGK